jgi:hypothetical protein
MGAPSYRRRARPPAIGSAIVEMAMSHAFASDAIRARVRSEAAR